MNIGAGQWQTGQCHLTRNRLRASLASPSSIADLSRTSVRLPFQPPPTPKFSWSPEADSAFRPLLSRFSSSSILCSIIVEVDGLAFPGFSILCEEISNHIHLGFNGSRIYGNWNITNFTLEVPECAGAFWELMGKLSRLRGLHGH